MAVASNSYTHLLGSYFGVLGHLWNQNDAIMPWLRLIANSNCFLHPHYTYKKCLSTLRTHPSAFCCPQLHASLSSRSKMPLLPPMPGSLLFGRGNPFSSCRPLLPPLPAIVLSLSSFPANACLCRSHGWLVVASFPTPLSTAHSIVHCPLHCPPLPSLTLFLPAAAPSSF